MLGELLNTALGPLKVKIWLAVMAALGMFAWAAVEIADNADKRKIEVAKEAGTLTAEVNGQRVTLQQNRDANDAEAIVVRGGDAAADECVRNARSGSGGNCARFR